MAKDPRKTEKATPRRRQKAREEGQVLRSQDIPISATLVAIFILFIFYLPFAFGTLIKYFKYTFLNSSYLASSALENFTMSTFKVVMLLTLPVLIVLLAVGVISNIAQFGFLFTLKPLTPKLDKLNPFSGIKRIFSITTLLNL